MDIHAFRSAVEFEIGRYLVGIVLQWNEHEPIFLVSCSLVNLYGDYYLLTAGHCLQAFLDDVEKYGKPDTIYLISDLLQDSRIPFRLDASMFEIINKNMSTDIGLIKLNLMYATPLMQDGVRSLSPRSFDIAEYNAFFIKGFYKHHQRKANGGAIYSPSPMLVLTLERNLADNRFCFSRAISSGVTVEKEYIESVLGLSGAMIYGAKPTGLNSVEICPVAIQSSEVEFKPELLLSTIFDEVILQQVLSMFGESNGDSPRS